MDGVLRGKYVSLEKFASAIESGLGFCDVILGWDITDTLYDNAAFTGGHTGYPDAHARVAILKPAPPTPITTAVLSFSEMMPALFPCHNSFSRLAAKRGNWRVKFSSMANA